MPLAFNGDSFEGASIPQGTKYDIQPKDQEPNEKQ